MSQIGDTASITDGVTTVAALRGVFRSAATEALSQQYGFTVEGPSYECRSDALAGLDKTKTGSVLRLTFAGRSYVVIDLRVVPEIGLTLLLLSP
ncbi:MAG: hypothetical protein QJR02_07250 [Sinobacteraceae bacterium]|nr:hypothetical protein [Nevskiaceae bacterium]